MNKNSLEFFDNDKTYQLLRKHVPAMLLWRFYARGFIPNQAVDYQLDTGQTLRFELRIHQDDFYPCTVSFSIITKASRFEKLSSNTQPLNTAIYHFYNHNIAASSVSDHLNNKKDFRFPSAYLIADNPFLKEETSEAIKAIKKEIEKIEVKPKHIDQEACQCSIL